MMSRDALLATLRDLFERQRRYNTDSRLEAERYEDPETWHERADQALLEYINDPEIKEAYEALERWYA